VNKYFLAFDKSYDKSYDFRNILAFTNLCLTFVQKLVTNSNPLDLTDNKVVNMTKSYVVISFYGNQNIVTIC
jgi:hypothetical protein